MYVANLGTNNLSNSTCVVVQPSQPYEMVLSPRKFGGTKKNVVKIGKDFHDPNDFMVIMIPNSQIPLGRLTFVTTSR
jgi:hypothetical protein